jgi:hypothetical protein
MSTSSSYGTPQDWATILGGTEKGASSAMQGANAIANSKVEAKEAKRRTLANLFNQARKRSQGLERVGREHSGDINDFQSQAMQQVARGFVEALQGSTR